MNVDIEHIMFVGEHQGLRIGKYSLPLLEEIEDILRRKGLDITGGIDGFCDIVGAVDFTQGDDFGDMVM